MPVALPGASTAQGLGPPPLSPPFSGTTCSLFFTSWARLTQGLPLSMAGMCHFLVLVRRRLAVFLLPGTDFSCLTGMKGLAPGGHSRIGPGEDLLLGCIHPPWEAFCVLRERCLGETGAWDTLSHPVSCHARLYPQPHCHPQNCSALPLSILHPSSLGILWLCGKPLGRAARQRPGSEQARLSGPVGSVWGLDLM